MSVRPPARAAQLNRGALGSNPCLGGISCGDASAEVALSLFTREHYEALARTLGRLGVKSPAHEAILDDFVGMLRTDNPTEFNETSFRDRVRQARDTDRRSEGLLPN